MYVEQALNRFGKYVKQQARTNLTKKDHKDTSSLYDSISYEVKVSKNSFQFSLSMEEYGIFLDKGVKGTESQAKAPISPYKFGTGTGKKGGLTGGIAGWVKRKRFQFRKPDGRFLSYATTSFLITRSIWKTGLKTTNFLTQPFERAFERLPEDIIRAYALDVDGLLKTGLKNG
jgi:hypothetical protein